MQTVLVTGGAGFIGSSLVSALMYSRNFRVIVLDNLSRGSKENIYKWLDSPNFEFSHVDLLDESNPSLQQAVDSSDIIVHLAANPDVIIGEKNTRMDFEQNVRVTYNLLEAIRKSQAYSTHENVNRKRKQLIFASSSTVYGKADKKPTSENYSPLHPISLYGATKLAGEAIISGYCHMFDIQCVIARLANIIGPTNRHGVVYDFIKKLSSHQGYLEILGNGQQNKSYLYIDDCVDALLLLLEIMQTDFNYYVRDDAQNRNRSNLTYEDSNSKYSKSYNNRGGQQRGSKLAVFNVGSDDTITVLQIAQIVIEQLSLKSEKVRMVFKDNFEDGRGWKGDVPDFWLDSSKLKNAGWLPKHGNSKSAIIKTCEEYLASDLLEGD